jgi:hypothetical protein
MNGNAGKDTCRAHCDMLFNGDFHMLFSIPITMIYKNCKVEVISATQAHSKGYWTLAELAAHRKALVQKNASECITEKNIVFIDGIYMGIKRENEKLAETVNRLL